MVQYHCVQGHHLEASTRVEREIRRRVKAQSIKSRSGKKLYTNLEAERPDTTVSAENASSVLLRCLTIDNLPASLYVQSHHSSIQEPHISVTSRTYGLDDNPAQGKVGRGGLRHYGHVGDSYFSCIPSRKGHVGMLLRPNLQKLSPLAYCTSPSMTHRARLRQLL